MSGPSPSWYDVLGVDADADADEIRAAWRTGIADLDPTNPRFRSLNQAAEVLLDHQRKADYDAELTDTTPTGISLETPDSDARPKTPTRQRWPRRREPKVERDGATSEVSGQPEQNRRSSATTQVGPQPAGSTALLVADPDVDATTDPATPVTTERVRTGPPVWLLLLVGILTALLVAAAVYLFTQPSDASIASNTDDAQAAAEQAATTILAYDYRQMDADQKAADALMTPAYAAKYNALFAQLKANAATVKPVVTAQVLASGIVRSGDDRVQVLVFVNRPTTRADGQQVVFHDQVRVTMEKSDQDWLVDDLQTDGAS